MLRNHFSTISCALLLSLGCSSSPNQATAGSGGANTGGTSSSCPAGSERCACYGNGTCDQGLECRSDLCVAASTSNGGTTSAGGSVSSGGISNTAGNMSTGGAMPTGGTNATGGRNDTGGATGNGGTAATGGTKASGGATNTGGAQATGGLTSTGGVSGAGGATCANTTSDWHNCGTCGRQCKSQGQFCGTNCCAAGQCAPFWGPCITQGSGYATCAEACASIGETCAGGSCALGSMIAQYSRIGWGPGLASNCVTATGPDSTSGAACDASIPWTGSGTTVRCCCTDTHS